MSLRPGTCSCPVPSGLILMSSLSPSLLSRSLRSAIHRNNNKKQVPFSWPDESADQKDVARKATHTLPEHLVVDLHRADRDRVRPHVLPLLDLTEEMFQGPLVDAWVLNTALDIQ